MTLIHCTDSCIYQSDGYCRLEKAENITGSGKNTDCPHFRPRDNNQDVIPYKPDSRSDFTI